MTKDAKVLIVMGSGSDHETMQAAREVLREFGIGIDYRVASAHRAPEAVAELARNAEKNGIKIIIAGAGGAAHLAGVVSAHTTLPVIGIPMETPGLGGLDSLLSTVQMPGGIPVATVAIGKGGAKNAGLLAVAILALNDEALREKLRCYRAAQTKKCLETKLPD